MVCPLIVDLPRGNLRYRPWRIVGDSLARLYLTGGLRLEGPTDSITQLELPGHQGRVAFAALALERRPVSHDELADIIWDGAPPARWRSALAAVVSKTRTLITTTGLDGPALLQSIGGTYAFAPGPDLWIDLECAYSALDRAEGALRHGDAAGATPDATVASAILRRPFLAGESCLWLDRIRVTQTDALYRTFITLAAAWNQIGDHQLAALTSKTAIQVDPYRETGHRQLIEAECRRGDSGAALRAFHLCTQKLEEIGAVPSAETRQLVEELVLE